MLPPMNMPQLTGPPTPEMLEKLSPIKYAVVGLWIAIIGRLCTGDFPLGDTMCGVSGVFLFKDDPSFVACYRCFMSTCLAQCAGQGGGGMACVMPFLFISIMNCLFMTFRLFTGGPFLLLSFICQLSAGTMAYQLNQLISATVGEGMTYQAQPLNQPFSNLRMNLGQPGGGPAGMGGGLGAGGGGGMGGGPSAGGAVAPGGRPFVPFAGSGQRLGD